jgi:alkylhydroperoxidase/carboxymuconolactone decarboxylase family protein YurZ
MLGRYTSKGEPMAQQADDEPVLDLLVSMTTDSLEASSLDAETLMLVRIAALVAVDAPASSYLMNLGAAGQTGVDSDQVQGVLAAVAPIVGAPRVVAAVSKMADALGIAIDLSRAGVQ